MGVQGFPTLKIVRPSKKAGKPTVEDYQGPRTAKAIVEVVKDKVPNTVKRVSDKNLDEWLAEKNETAKAILFSDKQAISATLRTLAIDFAGLVSVAQIRNKETKAVEMFGVEKYPTLLLLPGGTQDAMVFEGKMEKNAMVEFLSQMAPPNPDCPPAKAKKSKDSKKDDKKASKSSKFAKASASHKSSEASSAATAAQSETVEEPIAATESPEPIVNEDAPKPVEIPEQELKPTIPVLAAAAELQTACLNEKGSTCILAILPKDETVEAAPTAVASLAGIHAKHDKLKTRLFPFFSVPASNPLASSLLAELNLGSADEVHLIATNGKRGWWKKYSGPTFGSVDVETWVDAIRMGEGKKEKLPESLLGGEKAESKQEVKEEKVAEEEPVKIQVEEVVVEEEGEKKHDEL